MILPRAAQPGAGHEHILEHSEIAGRGVVSLDAVKLSIPVTIYPAPAVHAVSTAAVLGESETLLVSCAPLSPHSHPVSQVSFENILVGEDDGFPELRWMPGECISRKK